MESRRPMSELPYDVIHRIIVHHFFADPNLTNETAVQIGRLSKDLWSAVQSRPALFFQWSDGADPVKYLQELAYMESLVKQHTHLETLKIKASIYSSKPGIDRCIELAAATSPVLKHLKLDMWFSYVFPQPVFRVESLVHLDLHNGRLELPAQSLVMWPNLKTLCISEVHIGEGAFESIIRGCPLIETIEICKCRFNISNMHIMVFNLGCLKKVGISSTNAQTLELDAAPDLESLACSDFSAVDFGKHEYHKMRSLSLSRIKAVISNGSGDFLTSMARQFPRLEELSVCNVHLDTKRISISSTLLKKVILNNGIQGLEEATFDVPNLVHFEYDSNVIPKLSGNSCLGISRISFNISNGSIDTWWFLKLKEFLATLNMPVPSIRVSFEPGVTRFSIDTQPRSRADSVDAIYLCKHKYSTRFASEILDGIILIFQPKKIRLRNCWDRRFAEIVYSSLITSKIVDDPKLMWNVSEIFVEGWWTKVVKGSTVHRRGGDKHLKQPGAEDMAKFVELFKVFQFDWNPEFDFEFHLEYRHSSMMSVE